MSYKPILLVAGEPNSVFSEIFFKSLKKNHYKSPLIIIVSKNLLLKQMALLGFNYKINIIDEKYIDINELDNKKINIIDVEYTFKYAFEKITNKSQAYINNCFKVALKILKKNKFSKLINGPISKKDFLQGGHLGITEYLAKLTNKKNNVAMLIYNAKLSVSPITTHLPLKDVNKNITKKKIIDHVK